jgi:hypothetical protein
MVSPASTLAGLTAVVRGDIVTPTDPGWDEARQAWNLAVDQQPELVVLPVDVADVTAIVEFARRFGLKVTAQATGHDAGAVGPLEDTILLSTRLMRGVEIDTDNRTALVQAGTLSCELADAATKEGLFPLLGSSPDIGVVDFTLGGGVSWLGRRYGLAANHVTAIDVVTPTGSFVRATPEHRPDLFWALRGGGGNFGVVTAMEVELLPFGQVYAGTTVWRYERHNEVLDTWYELTRNAPDELTTALRIMHVPVDDDLPTFLSGQSVVVVDGAFVGECVFGSILLSELRRLKPMVDTWAPTTPSALGHMHMDPERPTPYLSDGLLVEGLDWAGLRAFSAAVRPGTGLLSGEIRHVGGALARTPEHAGAVGSLPCEHLVSGVGLLPGPEAAPPVLAALHNLREALADYDTGRTYGNLAERPVDPSTLYDPGTYTRLRAARSAIDPEGLMVASHLIPLDPSARSAPSAVLSHPNSWSNLPA